MLSRREILKGCLVGGVAVGAGACSGSRAPAPPPQPKPAGIGFEELVALLENTSRGQVLERVSDQIRRGLGREHLLAALFYAATRNLLTSQTFGKEQHLLLYMYPVHRAAKHLGWRPAMWAVDYFKWAQTAILEYQAEPMSDLAASALPAASTAGAEFERAMVEFDGARAEAAIVSLYRAGHRERVIEYLLRYGSKDFRHIGHKVIHVANGLRTLEVVGWEHAEVILRSVARTLALHYDVKGHDADSAWPRNQQLVERMGPNWRDGKMPDEAIVSLIQELRAADANNACDAVLDWLNRGASPEAVWTAMLLSSAELMMSHPTAVEALHAVTASNAAYATFRASKSHKDQQLLLLQNAARVAEFHRYTAWWAARRKRPARYDVKIEELQPAPLSQARNEAVDEIFADIGTTPERSLLAARKLMGFLSQHPSRLDDIAQRAQELGFACARDTHDLKLAVAVHEDAVRLPPAWRARFLAACSLRFYGSSAAPKPLTGRIESLLAT